MFGEWILVERITNKILKSSESLPGIKRSKTALLKKKPNAQYDIMPRDEYKDPMVETHNMMNGKKCMIRKSRLGTCCDPATERYWTM